MNFEFGKTREEKIDKFLDMAAWFHSTKYVTDHTANAVNKLTDELKEAGRSSDRLTEALNRISFWGVVIAAVGAIIAIANLGFEVFKYFANK